MFHCLVAQSAVSIPFVLGLGLPGGVVWLILLVVFGGIGVAGKAARSGSGGVTLILTRFSVSRSPTDGAFITIEGRPHGLIAFFLQLFGLAGNTSFRVQTERVTIDGARLSGKFFNAAPIVKVASTHCDFSRNILLLVLGVVSVIGALVGGATEGFGAFLLLLIVAALFLWGFVSSRTMSVTVVTDGGTSLGLRFKQGVIDGVSIDFARVEECIQIINQLVAAVSAPR